MDKNQDVGSFMNSILSTEFSQEDISAEVNRLKTQLGIVSHNSDGICRQPVQPGTSRQPVQPLVFRQPVQPGTSRQPVQPLVFRQPVQPGTSRQPVQPLVFRCPGNSCGDIFKTKKMLANHMQRLQGKSCFTCGKHFKTVSDAAKHRKKHCKNTRISKAVYHCDVCSKTMHNRTQFTHHRKSKDCVPNGLPGTTHSPVNERENRTCKQCSRTFAWKQGLRKHQTKGRCKGSSERTGSVNGANMDTHAVQNGGKNKYQCAPCRKSFRTPYYFNRHLGTKMCQKNRLLIGGKKTHDCDNCNRTFNTARELSRHQVRGKCTRGLANRTGNANTSQIRDFENDYNDTSVAGSGDSDNDNDGARQSALNDSVVRYTLRPVGAELYDIHMFFGNRRHRLTENLVSEIRRKRGVKWYVCLNVKMCKYDGSGELVDSARPYFRSSTLISLLVADHEEIQRQLNAAFFKISESLESFRRSGSGWILDTVLNLEQNIMAYKPLRGACASFELPEKLTGKDCILNVNSGDSERQDQCFKYCVLAGLHPIAAATDHPESYQHYDKHWDTLNMNNGDNDTAHMPVTRIGEFERRNNVSVNVIAFVDTFFPVRITDQVKEKHVNLLLVTSRCNTTDTDAESSNPADSYIPFGSQSGSDHYHYILITDINKLLSGQYDVQQHKQHFCVRCMNAFRSNFTLRKHEKRCSVHDPLNVRMPSDNEKWVRFQHHDREMKVKFVIFATFVCISKKLAQTGWKAQSTTNERQLLKHEPCGFAYYRTSMDDKYNKEPYVYMGEDCMDVFLDCMEREKTEVMDILSRTHPPVFRDTDMRRIQASRDTCHICNSLFLPGEIAVLSHSHYDGYVYGYAHQGENLNYKEANFLPILTHGFSSYDSRLILSAVGKYGRTKIEIIPKTVDTYISMTVGQCRYLDASRFLRDDKTEYVRQVYADMGIRGFPRLAENTKQDSAALYVPEVAFCHAYVDSFNRLLETRLPKQCEFYDPVTESTVDDAAYERTRLIWSTLGLQHVGDLLQVHMLAETLLLADIWEHFRSEVMSTFELDPTHYFTLSHYAWDCALKVSDTTVELLQDQEMHLMVESGIRGGYAFVGSPRYARANSELMGEQFNPDEKKSYLCYLDVNSLFAHIMKNSYLPLRCYRWLDDFELNRLHVLSIAPDADKGLILEVDLEYPTSLHDLHDTFPLAPETMLITEADLSPYMHGVYTALGLNIESNNKRNNTNNKNYRLVANLGHKAKYVLHYLNLQFYLRQGMRLKKIHRALEFTQAQWLHPYISTNLEKRAQATSTMAKQLYKDMSNVIYGKSLQSVRDKLDVKLVTSDVELQRLVSLPTFESCRVFHEKLVAVNLRRQSVVLNKPILTGMCILDLSKIPLYDYHYSYFMPKFSTGGKTCQLLMSDTDSLLYRITGTEDLYADLKTDGHLFDFSNLSPEHPLYSEHGKGMSGRLKLELGDRVLFEFCGLCAKSYSILTDKTCKVAAKSLSESAARRNLTHDRFRQCLASGRVITGDVNRLVTEGTNIYTVTSHRTLVSAYNDKRWFQDHIHSFSFGHHKIQQLKDSRAATDMNASYLDAVYDLHVRR